MWHLLNVSGTLYKLFNPPLNFDQRESLINLFFLNPIRIAHLLQKEPGRSLG